MKIELRIEQEFGEQFGGSWEYRLYAWMPRESLYLNSFESLEKAESAIKETLKNNFQSLAELLHYFNYGGDFESDYFFTPIEINP